MCPVRTHFQVEFMLYLWIKLYKHMKYAELDNLPKTCF